jgi:hypothetical protein
MVANKPARNPQYHELKTIATRNRTELIGRSTMSHSAEVTVKAAITNRNDRPNRIQTGFETNLAFPESIICYLSRRRIGLCDAAHVTGRRDYM